MGFQHLKAKEQTKVSRRGAQSLHKKKKAHSFTSEQARAAANKRWNKDVRQSEQLDAGDDRPLPE
jgi:hypothetical protein